MANKPASSNTVTFDLDDFDNSNLPPGVDITDRHAVKLYFEKDYGTTQRFVDVSVDEKTVHIAIDDQAESKYQQAINFLQTNQLEKGTNTLNELLSEFPHHIGVKYNLALVLSDNGDVGQAITLLTQVVEQDPEHIHAAVGLSVAYQRSNQIEQALSIAQLASEKAPEDPFALRTYGSLLSQTNQFSRAATILERAQKEAPSDPTTLLSLAHTLMQRKETGDIDKADALYKKVIALAPGSPLADSASKQRTRISSAQFRKQSAILNEEAIRYCATALKLASSKTEKELAGIALELSTIGQSGVDVNNAESRYYSNSLQSELSGLELVSTLHTLVQELSPGQDTGFDVQPEYLEAKRLHQ